MFNPEKQLVKLSNTRNVEENRPMGESKENGVWNFKETGNSDHYFKCNSMLGSERSPVGVAISWSLLSVVSAASED